MCSGGLGNIDHGHLAKAAPQKGWLVVKIGGPAYRIGLGGGAASSVASGSNKADLDFNAVQVRALCVLSAYCIGMGGAAASCAATGSNKADLDFNAVQVRPKASGCTVCLHPLEGPDITENGPRMCLPCCWPGLQPALASYRL